MNIDGYAKKIAAGDESAFEELYSIMRTPVYAVCIGVVKHTGQAQDLTQDTFISVWENISYFQGKGLKSWILTIAKNKSLNALRKSKREVFSDFQEENVADRYELDGVETRILLRAALDRLDDESRQIVLMKNAGLKTKEIAALMEMPRGTVSWKYAEALKTLRKILTEEGV